VTYLLNTKLKTAKNMLKLVTVLMVLDASSSMAIKTNLLFKVTPQFQLLSALKTQAHSLISPVFYAFKTKVKIRSLNEKRPVVQTSQHLALIHQAFSISSTLLRPR
jgi:hypothetical protein